MSALSDEIDANGGKFSDKWPGEIAANIKSLKGNKKLVESYRRITAIQALKSGIIEPNYSKEAGSFYAEAQNDALTSHVFASFGAWRSALQALRGCIENTLCALYYNDHPIELRRWSSTDFKVGFSELHTYFSKHPDIVEFGLDKSGLEQLKEEYATLSKAVHASAPSFRMTDPASKILLWGDEGARLGMWATRERKVIEAVCLLTISINNQRVAGTSQPNVRAALAFAISSDVRKKLKKAHVHIDEPS